MAVSDPNWFYSTLAQSTAAIVGLVGAFLIQRILTTRSEIVGPRSDIRKEALACVGQMDRVRAALTANQKELVRNRPAVAGAASTGKEDVVVVGPLTAQGPDGGGIVVLGNGQRTSVPTTSTLEVIDEVSDLSARVDEWLPTRRSFLGKPAKLEDIDLPDYDISTMPLHGYWQNYSRIPVEFEGALDEVADWSGRVEDAHAVYVSRLNLRGFSVLLGVLTFLLVVGVIVPLFFLSDSPSFDRGWLIGGFAIGTLALLGYYGFELRALARSSDLNDVHI